MQFPDSDATCRYVRTQTDTVMLGWSGGADSIFAYFKLRQHGFTVVPIHQIHIPGPPEHGGRGTLPYLQRILDRQEQLIGQRIYRVPHVSFYMSMSDKVYQPPERFHTLEDLNQRDYFPRLDYYGYNDWIKAQAGLDHAWTATGIKVADNIYRRRHIGQHGSVLEKRRHFYPAWDVTDAQGLAWLEAAHFPLSVEYIWFGRSLCGMDARFSWVLREKSPEDFATLKFWYPLADLDIVRLQARPSLMKRQRGAVRKVTMTHDPDDAFLLEGVEKNLQDGIADIAAALQGERKTSGMADNMSTTFWIAAAFQSQAAKEAFLERAKLASLGNKYFVGEELARILGIDLSDIPIPGVPRWPINQKRKAAAEE